MRASRLLSILLLIQAKGRVTAHVLAARFEVSVRTIYRDIDELSAAGVPVYADRGPTGGFALLDGYRTRLTGMTAGEVETLAIAGLKDVASDLGLSDRLYAAQLKLVAALPEAKADVSRIGARLHVDAVDWYKRPLSTPCLPLIASAVWEQKRLSMRYAGWLADGDRIVEPLGLVLKGGNWYLVARRKATTRIYRIANIERPAVLDETFERPPAFNLPDEWAAAVARFETGLLREIATLRITDEGISRLRQVSAAALAGSRQLASDDDWKVITIPMERLDFAAEQLLGIGPHVEVLDPPELRQRLRDLAEAVVALNQRRRRRPKRLTTGREHHDADGEYT